MKKKQGLKGITSSLNENTSSQKNLYLGNKINNGYKSYSAHGGSSYSRRTNSGCGLCGNKVVKKANWNNKK
ncbi:hypothetical protein [Neobacillus mesonae]|uniref:hypothetical protein n=1 Tax=Neobacillus mesonae TaxID=1193713 RepID=UPI002E20BE78|nr:hypothetical protein [Neobacillus mesonae]